MPDQPSRHREKEDLRDRLFRALGDRSRRRIIRSLLNGPLHVGDIALQLDDPTRAGYHLRVLRDAGIVHPIKEEGRHVSYEYDRASLVELKRMLDETQMGLDSK